MENKKNQIKEMQDEKDIFTDLDILAKTKGGEILVKNLVKDLVTDIDSLCMGASTFTMQEFVTIASRMKEKINIVRVLSRAEKNKEFLTKQIKEEIADELQR